MVIAVVACAAVASAASFDWKTSATGKIYGAGTTTLLASGTAYIFDAATVSQQSLVEALVTDGSLMAGSLSSKAINNGAITATAAEDFAWSGGDALNAYSQDRTTKSLMVTISLTSSITIFAGRVIAPL